MEDKTMPTGDKVEIPEPEGWIEEMIADIDAHFKKNPDVPIFKTMTIG